MEQGQHAINKKKAFSAIPVTISVQLVTESNTIINANNVLQYEFINISNVPVMINGVFIDRYYSGALGPNMTVIAGSAYRFAPIMKAGERDTGVYTVLFNDALYTGTSAQHKLYVVKKIFSPPMQDQQG